MKKRILKRLLSSIMMIAVLASSVSPLQLIAKSEYVFFESENYTPTLYLNSNNPVVSYTTIEDAAYYVREKMVNREAYINFSYVTKSSNTDFVKNILYLALAHTGIPDEGDYIEKNLDHYGYSFSGYIKNGTYYYNVSYNMYYFTTKEEENVVEEKIKELFDEWDIENKSDYEKIRTIYEYIVHNVVYDYEHLGNPAYTKQFSAYAALLDGTSVCQGYASLLYRMLLTAEIDCRIETGMSDGPTPGRHAWNIIELNGIYYDCDSTWDAILHDCDEKNYQYFLMGSEEFDLDHILDQEFETDDYKSNYPTSEKDYHDEEHTPCEIKDSVPFTFELPNGGSITDAEYDNTNTLIIYADTGSGNCSNLLKGLNNHIQELKAVGLKVIVVFESSITDKKLTEYATQYPDFIISRRPVNDKSLGQSFYQYGFSGSYYYPVVFFKNHNNKLVHFSKGHVAINQDYIDLLVSLVDEESLPNHSLETVIVPATCTQDGYMIHTCTVCGYTYTDSKVSATGHSFTNYISDGNATTEADGTKTAKCDNCDVTDTIVDEGSKICSNHVYNSVVTSPTCTEDGYTTHTCAACNDSYVDSEVPATGHSFTNYVSDGNATTEADGTKTAKCDNCEETDTVIDEGSKIHVHSYDSVVTKPTCTDGGYTKHTCECGDSYIDTEVSATGHSFTNYVSDGNATTEADGTKTAKCDNCDETDTVIDEGSKIDPSAIVYGDIDGDNKINMNDVVMMLRHVTKAIIITDSKAIAACDIVEDGVINMDDVIRLLRFVSKAIPNLK